LCWQNCFRTDIGVLDKKRGTLSANEEDSLILLLLGGSVEEEYPHHVLVDL
jgi:hypothetical protein